MSESERTRVNVALIARREITTRTQQRGFRIGLGVTLLLIAIVAVLPRFIGGSSTKYDVGVGGPNASAISSTVSSLAGQRNLKVVVHPVKSVDEAASKVRSGSWDAALADDSRILAKSDTSTAAALLNAARQSVLGVERLKAAGVDPGKVSSALDVAALPVTVSGGDNNQRQLIATITIVALFGQLIGFCSWVAMGVVEEKSSRVIELILATVRPWQLLAGKLIGIGSIAIGQMVAYAVVGLGVATAVGRVHLPPGTVSAVAVSVGWFVLAFGFFAALSAALGSLVSRQEEVSGVLAPVTGLLMVSYFLGFFVVGSPDSGAAKILSFIPPISGIAMPARMIRGDVPAGEILLGVALMLIATIVVLGLGAKIYRAAVLHSGSKLSLSRAWRSEAVADLA
ncbi:MAG: ABC-type Na+ efflux pump permease component-like protein [Pseudonocardiales bacterium]|nr:ABC-type Na+ efflux pump permease component-like protein [Pseudonocardiales bacterium]